MTPPVKLNDTFFAEIHKSDHVATDEAPRRGTAQKGRRDIPLRVLGLDESDEMRVDVEIGGHGRLAGLRRGGVCRLEEVCFVE